MASIAAIVTSEYRTRTRVSQYVRAICPAFNPIINPATIPDTRIPLPVADSQFNVNTASSGFVGRSGVGEATTGGERITTLCRAATWNFGAAISLKNFFTLGTPHRKTTRLSNTHGAQARMTSARVCAAVVADTSLLAIEFH